MATQIFGKNRGRMVAISEITIPITGASVALFAAHTFHDERWHADADYRPMTLAEARAWLDTPA